jgi:hypothetical protein
VRARRSRDVEDNTNIISNKKEFRNGMMRLRQERTRAEARSNGRGQKLGQKPGDEELGLVSAQY